MPENGTIYQGVHIIYGNSRNKHKVWFSEWRGLNDHNSTVTEAAEGGMGMRLCELRDKEVVNICSGRRLGCIVDVEINICSGEVEAVIIPGPGKICGFLGTDCEYVIPFACIRKIGPDLEIVEIQEEKFFFFF